MAIAFPTYATTGRTAYATTHVANMPSGIVSGELVIAVAFITDPTRHLLAPTGWDVGNYNNVDSTYRTFQYLFRIADGTEGATETFTYSASSDQASSVIFRVTGANTSDPFNTNNYVFQTDVSEATWTTDANSITGIDSSNNVILFAGGTGGVRTLTTPDTGQTLIASVNDGNSIHVLYESSPGSGNTAYSNEMSGGYTRHELLLEIKAAAAGGGGIEILRRRTEGS